MVRTALVGQSTVAGIVIEVIAGTGVVAFGRVVPRVGSGGGGSASSDTVVVGPVGSVVVVSVEVDDVATSAVVEVATAAWPPSSFPNDVRPTERIINPPAPNHERPLTIGF